MKEYYLKIPMAGSVEISVEAESEKEAIEKAMNEATIKNVGEWEMFTKIVEGNVLYAPQWEIEIEDCGEVEP